MTIPDAGENVERLDRSYINGRNVKWYIRLKKSMAVSYKMCVYQKTQHLHSWAFILAKS